MFDNITDKLERVFKKLRSYGKLDESNIKDALREVRIALLEADVNFKVVKGFIDKIKERAVGEEVLNSLTPGQQVIKIVHDEMIHLLGDEQKEISFSKTPAVIMMVGLQGAGKTTTAGKIACWLKEKKKEKILLISVDVYRPAAQEQLSVIGKELQVEVFSSKGNIVDPVKLCEEGLKKGAESLYDAIIFDTAGRLQVDEKMMEELKVLKDVIRPSETLLVVDAMTGQEAVNVAKKFDEVVGVDGIVLTKMDGDARGGAALSVRAVTGRPVKFVGSGEKLDNLEPFYPDRMASRILGMGDVLSLIEKAKNVFEEENALKLEKKIKNDSFTLNDFLVQLKQIRNMGPLEQIMKMIPGMGKLKGVKVEEGQMIKTEAIINSMTKIERERESIINGSRRKRIARGSGTSVFDVNRLLKQFKQMKIMMKKFSKGGSRGNSPFGKGMFPGMG